MFPGLFDQFLEVNLFRYITFRMAAAGLSAFAFALWWGRPVIGWLKKNRVGEKVEKTEEESE